MFLSGLAGAAWAQPAGGEAAGAVQAVQPAEAEGPGAVVEEPPPDSVMVEAAERFDRGVQFYEDGEFGAALAEFLRAYELTGNWVVLYNLGQVSQGMGRRADALRYFERYLAEGGAEVDGIEGRRAEVEANLAGLRGRLALLDVEVDVEGAEVLVDDEIVGTAPLAEPVVLDPGPHVVVGRHPDHGTVRLAVTLASDTRESISLVLTSPAGSGPTEPVEEEWAIERQWWFWTIIGAVVAGGAVTAGVMLAPRETIWTDGPYYQLD
jgi:hypothetical protein